MTQILIVTLLFLVSAALADCPNAAYKRSAVRPKRDRISPAREHVVRLLDRGLQGSPMARTGRALEASGHKWRVSPFLIAGIAAKESTLGQAACRSDRFNVFGLASCTGHWGRTLVPRFRSWAHVYDYEARFLHSRWPMARSPWDLHRYAACTSCWAASVAAHMRRLFGVAPTVRYP